MIETTELSNREIGNLWMTYILSELYEAWPRRIDLSAEMARNETGEAVDEEDEFFDDLILWLEREGYIRTSQESPEGIAYGAALTNKGHALLLEKEAGARTMGERMKDQLASVAKEGVSSAKSEIIGQLVGAIIGAAAKQIGFSA